MSKSGSIYAASASSIGIRFSYRGVRCREFLRMTPTPRNLAYAANLRGQILTEIAKGVFDYHVHFPNSPRAKLLTKQPGAIVTVASKLDAWLAAAKPNIERSTYIGYERAIAVLSRTFGRTLLRDITRSQIRAWIGEQTSTAKRVSNLLTPLRQMLAEALDEGLIAQDPMHGIKIKRRGPREDDIDPFTPAEVRAILDACTGQFRNLVQFAFWTGMRTSELIALRWQDIDWTHGLVLVRQAKVNGQIKGPKTTAGRREIKLLPPALEALKAQKAHTLLAGAFVFHDPRTAEPWVGDKQVREWAWRPALARSKVRYRYPYQTRHTYASTLLSAGENPMWVAHQMGHKDWVMIVRIYARWVPAVDPTAGDKALAACASHMAG